MKKRGFTLIELLAVIIILAIITLITTPIIMRVIETTKKEAAQRSAVNYIRQIEEEFLAQRVSGNQSHSGEYIVDEDGNICLKSVGCTVKIEINMNGKKPNVGKVTISENGKVSFASLEIGDYTVTIDENNNVSAVKYHIKEDSGTSVITTSYKADGEILLDYRIYGNSVQNGTPTPSNPIEIESVGDLITDSSDENYGKYKIPVIVSDGTNSTTTNIYLDEPLRKLGDYADYVDFKNGKVIRNIKYYNSSDLSSLSFSTGTQYTNDTCRLQFRTIANPNYGVAPMSNGAKGKTGGINTTPNNVTASSTYSYYYWYFNSNDVGLEHVTTQTSNAAITTAIKNYIVAKGLDLQIVLTTPTEESITLPSIPSIKGTTIYTVDTNIQPSNMYVKYKGI